MSRSQVGKCIQTKTHKLTLKLSEKLCGVKAKIDTNKDVGVEDE